MQISIESSVQWVRTSDTEHISESKKDVKHLRVTEDKMRKSCICLTQVLQKRMEQVSDFKR